MPLHPKAKDFAKSGLFAGVKSFDQLEKRIAAIPENKGKGDAFEVFAEAYLATQRKHEVKTAWPLDGAPLSVLKKLKLPLKDYGVDGVMQTTLGGHQVYQVKFRSGRTPLTWEELSTFMGLSDSPEIQSKVVLTNCDELPAVINERHNFFCIRGSDLDRLTAQDFKTIEGWVSESVVAIKKSAPFPHQQEALDALLPALKTEDRVSAIMACGTGKTLTALWTTEQLRASKVLVLLPSLALLRQTLHEWLKETSLDSLAYLCVCSDPSVKDDADAISTAQSDLDFEVSTDSSTVRRFLDVPFKGTKVIFSTYQSAAVVGEAMKKGESFDLGIFDEAHKTAGREGRNYGYALEDKNIAIRKRLFVTATPRHYNPSKRNKEGEATVAFSMDEPKVYGPQSYVLSFGEAARRKIICGYKVIISVINSDQVEDVNDEILSKGAVTVKGDEIRARQVANQIALRDAVAQYGVSKIFTFHSTVKSAASFTSDGSEGVGTHLQDFSALHVSGAMPTARRERVMKEFRSAPRAVMSNARCLTEGVDVPAVDMVAFLSPRKSKVDIVQAIGRAMRKSRGKEVGYVLIPLYLEQKAGESIETAVARANFEEVWDILQSLQEQDEELADAIKEAAQAKGSGKGFDDSRFKDRIAFTGPVLALESIRQAVTTRVLERLESSWDVNFGKLVKFKEEHGHCLVPAKFHNDIKLGRWVGLQRTEKKLNILPWHRESALDNIGFSWRADLHEKSWDERYEDLKRFKKDNGHCVVPVKYTKDSTLGMWVSRQRKEKKGGLLSNERITLLNQLGFCWNTVDALWELQFSEIKRFQSIHGHCNILKSDKDFTQLYTWIGSQRTNKRRGILSLKRIQRLDELGFLWEPSPNSIWDVNFGKLVKFKEKHGHCLVPAKYHKDIKLGRWVSLQRTEKKLNILPRDRESTLDNIGFSWTADLHEKSWDERYEDLKRFKKEYGNCNVPSRYTTDSLLGKWVSRQRVEKKAGVLSNERITLLNQLGFCWDAVDALWELRFSELKRFQSIHGHCNILKSDKDFIQLYTWIGSQRSNKRRGILSLQRTQRLDELGFLWNFRLENWDSFFSELVSFKKEHGHCDVRKYHGARLHRWIISQRDAKKRDSLSFDRTEKLNSIGFIWALNDNLWSRRYAELKDFSKIHGHCIVPTRSGDLGKWVSHQRNRKKSGKITQEEESLLNRIGFNWGTNFSSWESRCSDLRKFKTEHSHCNVPRDHKEFPTLGSWIAVQRVKRRKGLLSESQIKALDELGFIWNAGKTKTEKSSKTWEESFTELIRFKESFGHCNVPRSYTASSSLALWVSNQRAKKKRGVLLSEREKPLNSIGFEWKLR